MNYIQLLIPPFVGILLITVLLSGGKRTCDTYFVFLVFSLAAVLVKKNINLGKFGYISLIIVSVPSLLLPPKKELFFELNYNVYEAASEVFSGKLDLYRKEMIEREQTLEKSNTETVILKKLSYLPTLPYAVEIPSEKERSFINNQMEEYYNKKSIVTE